MNKKGCCKIQRINTANQQQPLRSREGQVWQIALAEDKCEEKIWEKGEVLPSPKTMAGEVEAEKKLPS